MAQGRRREWIGALLGAVVTLFLWLLWQRDELSDAASKPSATDAVGTKPRAERRRDAAAPVPSTQPDSPSPKSGTVEALAKLDPEKTFPLAVTVLRADGSPAAGASVLLVDAHPVEGEEEVEHRATADDLGVARLRSPEVLDRVVAWLGAEARATTERFNAGKSDHVTLRLAPAVRVHGRVLRGELPESAAHVRLSVSPWFGSSSTFVLTTKSDVDGRFEFPPIATSGVDPPNPPEVLVETRDAARGAARVDVARPDAEIVVRLTPGFTVRGRLVDVGGKPADGLVIVVDGFRRMSRTPVDSDGRFEIRRAEASCRFVALRRGPGDTGSTDRWRCAYVLGYRPAGSTGDVDLGTIVLKPGKPVVGLVVDASGKPAEGASAALMLNGVAVGGAFSDVAGRFVMPEVSGDSHVVHVDGGPLNPGYGDVSGVRGGDPELRVVLAPKQQCWINVKLLSDGDRTRVVVRNPRLRAWRSGETSPCVDVQIDDDPDSYFTLAVPSPGSYDVEVAAPGFEPQRVVGVEAVVESEVSAVVALRRKRD